MASICSLSACWTRCRSQRSWRLIQKSGDVPKYLESRSAVLGVTPSLPADDLVDPLKGHVDCSGKVALGHAERQEKLLQQHFALGEWVHGRSGRAPWPVSFLLMVVRNLDFGRARAWLWGVTPLDFGSGTGMTGEARGKGLSGITKSE